LLVIIAAHSLASSAFFLSDEFPQIKVAVGALFFNKLLVRQSVIGALDGSSSGHPK
jgi:hypothetical protein